jgi:uncharacterized protein
MIKESRYNIWLEHDDYHYVFNGISGALLRISEQEYLGFQQYLAGETEVSCSFQILEQLAMARVFVPEDADELGFLKKRYTVSRGNIGHFGLTIVTSLGCNFDCPYCFEDKHPSIIDAEVEKLVLEMLDDQLPKIETFAVTWFGGEPLVGKKPLLSLSDAFIERCRKMQVAYSASIVTNGYLLDESTCADLRDRGVSNAQIGLDGPPSTHNKMRPLAGGKESFWKIVENIHHAIKYMNVSIRVNVDKANLSRVEELMQILNDEGLAGRLIVYPGQITEPNRFGGSALITFSGKCFSNPEFARAEADFNALTQRYGFSKPTIPGPVTAPCTAVRANELVVGSAGELYKCWNSVGDPMEVIGTIRDYANPNGRLQKWLKYDPFENSECRTCIALPVCLGGCASHAMTPGGYENRCGTFRHTHAASLERFVLAHKGLSVTTIVQPQSLAQQTETR